MIFHLEIEIILDASSFVTGCVEGSVYLWQVNLSRDFSDDENGKLLISVTLRMVLTNEDGRIADVMKWYDSAVSIFIFCQNLFGVVSI
jgi:hypothetical protein